MRMIALGQAWCDQGGAVQLIGKVGPLAERVVAEGVTHVPLDPEGDLETLLAHTHKGEWVVIDGYQFDTEYQRAVRRSGRRTVVLDDVNDRGAYDADLLLNQNCDAEGYKYTINSSAGLLLGLRYVLLRREFLTLDPEPMEDFGEVRVLVTLGGADPDDNTSAVLGVLSDLGMPGMTVKVVAGALYPHKETLMELARSLPFPCEVLHGVSDMAPLMAWAEVAVTAAGSTCWELCRMGVPMALCCIADNQKGIYSRLVKEGVAVPFELQVPASLADALQPLLEDSSIRELMSARARSLVDGGGARRVVNAMRNLDIRLRPAIENDMELLLRWRNAPEVRKHFFKVEAVSYAEHREWFLEALDDDDIMILIAETESGRPVGQVRWDMGSDKTTISVAVAPEVHGRGIGSRMVELACEVHSANPSLRKVTAFIKADNLASKMMFMNLGFVHVGDHSDSLGQYSEYVRRLD